MTTEQTSQDQMTPYAASRLRRVEARAVVYFRCERLNARMTVASCAAQYGAANGGGDSHGQRFVQKANRSQCVDCPIGKAHRRGEPTPPELVVAPPTLHVVRDVLVAPPRAAVAPTGEVAKGEASNAGASVPQPQEVEMAKKPIKPQQKQKQCSKCGKAFVPTGPAGRYCVACKGAKVSTVTQKPVRAAAAPKAVQSRPAVRDAPSVAQAMRDAFVVRATPGDVLKAAGFEVVRELAVAAGTMLVIVEGTPP